MGLPVFRSFFWVSIEKLAILGIQFVGTMVLARLIEPSNFGMIGILAVFIALANMLVDSGMGGSLVKETTVVPADFHTLFIYNGVISFIAYLILFILSPYIAEFYNIPELCGVLRVLGLSIIFTSLSITQSVHLLRNLEFKKMTICATISSLLATSTSVLMAYGGLGIWALVSQTLGYSIYYSISLFIVAKYIPRLAFDMHSFKRQFSYGINILVANVLNTVQSNISSSIVGKFFSLTSTGYYAQANRLQGLPNNIIVSIIEKAAFPIISKHEDINEKVYAAYVIGRYIYIFAFPLWGFCIVMATPLVRVILGTAWLDSAWMFSLLSWAGPFYTIKSISRSIFKSTGDTRVIFHVDMVVSILGILIMIVTGRVSMEYLIYAVILTAIFSMGCYMLEVRRNYGYGIIKQIASIFPATIPSILSSLILVIIVNRFPVFSNNLLGVVSCFIMYVLLCSATYICFRNKEFISLVTKVLARIKA